MGHSCMGRLGECTWQEAEKAVKEADFCIIPFGSFEQHGPRLPLETDSLLARGIIDAAGDALAAAGSSLRLTVLPVVQVGMSPEHSDFPGTISLTKETFFGYADSLLCRLAELGARRIVLFNCHGGNTPYLQIAMREYRKHRGIIVLLFDVYSSESLAAYAEALDYHAGAVETSLMLHLFPEAVRPAGIAGRRGGVEGTETETVSGKAEFFASPAVPWISSDFSESGVIGDPGKADADTGKKLLEGLTAEFGEFLSRARKFLPGGGQSDG